MTDWMMIKPVVLWSDSLIFLLALLLILFFVHMARNPVARMRWRTVFASPTGMGAFLVILFYILVALLDSIHFRQPLEQSDASSDVHYSQQVDSVLDLIIGDLRGKDEKTYSAPFAIYSFAKETRTLDDGSIVRDFPRLEHAGVHLSDPAEHWHDIRNRTLEALLIGLAISAALVLLHWQWRNRCDAVACGPRKEYLPWKTIYGTLAFLVFATVWVLKLGGLYHILGTNMVGQDTLYQAIKGIRTGVLIGTLATILTMPLAIVLGICAGYFRGRVDDLVQYVYTTLSSIPGILLIAASILLIDVYIETHPEQFALTVERADFRFLALCFILGMTSWTGLCRLLRAETLKVSQLDYVQAARAFGVPHWRILASHILPNITHLILISLVLDFSGFVLAEAILSYIGVGVDPTMASWGNMINDARAELSRDPVIWWSVSAAFLLMFGLVLAANLFSDRVRDAFDPRAANKA
ncbi:ABC transporter permease [Parathalassolituus penaei]|uniref:ABC transporter permease n=1 Tax=Parathalassolituus penaei TaxID=2997323 RepID=A0A9X3IQ08_9GAMM|nr:ABC transporter permease [Parathalassolituus penaei]MCY0963652.1 ABC transporter permease [Parathalassolituus penaei]